jgi:hypothetical protein
MMQALPVSVSILMKERTQTVRAWISMDAELRRQIQGRKKGSEFPCFFMT